MSNGNKKFWKSLNEYYDDPEVLEKKANEFNEGVTDEFHPSNMNSVSRRKFLALMSASAAFAVTACTDYRDKGEIVPYTERPEGILPGKPDYYASTCTGCSMACGILVKTREGRPIKVDGNPDNPVNRGKLCTKGQAGIMNLYDPDRLAEPLKGNSNISWNEVDDAIKTELAAVEDEGKEIAVICGAVTSPTQARLLNEFVEKYPTAKIYSYEFFNSKNREDAWRLSYGSDEIPSVKWEDANIVLAIDSDFLGKESNQVENTRRFTSRRDVMKNLDFTRLYSVEGGMSLTGANADYRFRLRPDLQYDFVMSLVNEIVLTQNAYEIELTDRLLSEMRNYNLKKFAEQYNLNPEHLEKLVFDLIQNKGKAIVHAGDTMPVNVHLAVNLLNEVLGNTPVYDFESAFKRQIDLSSMHDFKSLVSKLNGGEVGVVLHLDVNPVYHFPSSLNYKSALEKAGTSVSLTEYKNETAELCGYVLPIHNSLESWGDYKVRSNVYSLQQPVISPMYNTRQKEAVLLNWLYKGEFSQNIYHKYLMDNFKDSVYSLFDTPVDFNRFWYSALHDGLVKLESEPVEVQFDQNSVPVKSEALNNFEGTLLHLQYNYFLGDGKFSNNGWLQETPHPVSKITWDNYAAISPNTAKKLSVENNDLVKIDVDGKSIELPVFEQPGMADDLVVAELGYGRTAAGEIGNDVGFDLNDFIRTNENNFEWLTAGVSLSKSNGKYALISTQEHHQLDDDFVKDFHLIRDIIQEGTIEGYKKHPHFLQEKKHSVPNITETPLKFENEKWAMAIDLNKCTSCSACVTACNVENNVPVVGKDQVAVGREMQWMRLDRYYSGTPDEPVVSNQPMLCQHCDNAPCENVCPVNATNHSEDGLNQMVYNRCVGTRYCSNNCPYKVRRFNFFNFRDHFADAYYENDVLALAHNPEVTVRSRGVMEKCTFCVQRIMEEREDAIRENRSLDGDNVKTACQVACPADAIVFGDVNKIDSPIHKYSNHELGYRVLENYNFRPNVTYIAKLRNTHSEEV